MYQVLKSSPKRRFIELIVLLAISIFLVFFYVKNKFSAVEIESGVLADHSCRVSNETANIYLHEVYLESGDKFSIRTRRYDCSYSEIIVDGAIAKLTVKGHKLIGLSQEEVPIFHQEILLQEIDKGSSNFGAITIFAVLCTLYGGVRVFRDKKKNTIER